MRVRAAIYLLFAILLLAKPAIAEPLSPYHVKAACIYNFLKFVEWPPNTLPGDSPYVVGVLGKDPFGTILDETMRGKTINGRRIVLQRITESNMQRVHLLYISASERDRYRQIIQALRFAPVLTVGETQDFAESGGTIEFYIENNKVRFEMNPEAAKRADLRINANLLSLGRLVRTR